MHVLILWSPRQSHIFFHGWLVSTVNSHNGRKKIQLVVRGRTCAKGHCVEISTLLNHFIRLHSMRT